MAGAAPEPSRTLDMGRTRETFEASTDFTIGLEEEFALLDPRDARAGPPLRGRSSAACRADELLAASAAGELIDSEIEIRSGRGETLRRGASSCSASAAARLFALAERARASRWARPAPTPGPTTSTSGSSTPSTTAGCARSCGWVAQRNNTWSLHVHVGDPRRRPRDRRLRPAARRAAAAARRSRPTRRSSTAATPGCTRCAREIFTRTFPRCGVHEPFGDWDAYADFVDLLDARPARSSSRRSSGGACARTTASAPSRCGSATRRPRGDESFALAGADRRLHRAGGARLRRAAALGDAAAPARDRGEPLAGDPPRARRHA